MNANGAEESVLSSEVSRLTIVVRGWIRCPVQRCALSSGVIILYILGVGKVSCYKGVLTVEGYPYRGVPLYIQACELCPMRGGLYKQATNGR